VVYIAKIELKKSVAIEKDCIFSNQESKGIVCIEIYSSEKNFNISLFEIIANPDLSLD